MDGVSTAGCTGAAEERKAGSKESSPDFHHACKRTRAEVNPLQQQQPQNTDATQGLQSQGQQGGGGDGASPLVAPQRSPSTLFSASATAATFPAQAQGMSSTSSIASSSSSSFAQPPLPSMGKVWSSMKQQVSSVLGASSSIKSSTGISNSPFAPAAVVNQAASNPLFGAAYPLDVAAAAATANAAAAATATDDVKPFGSVSTKQISLNSGSSEAVDLTQDD